jgi:hypothetical protein
MTANKKGRNPKARPKEETKNEHGHFIAEADPAFVWFSQNPAHMRRKKRGWERNWGRGARR